MSRSVTAGSTASPGRSTKPGISSASRRERPPATGRRSTAKRPRASSPRVGCAPRAFGQSRSRGRTVDGTRRTRASGRSRCPPTSRRHSRRTPKHGSSSRRSTAGTGSPCSIAFTTQRNRRRVHDVSRTSSPGSKRGRRFSETGSMKRAMIVAVVAVACVPAEPPPLPANTSAFAVFGDGPYRLPERAAFGRLIDDVNRSDVAWFLHVGDILSGSCSNKKLDGMLEQLNTIRHPVLYTPGDNEWTDCHRRSFDPLERLQRIRATYFKEPTKSIAGAAMPVESQSADPAWKEFVENVRWRRGGFLFVTVHLVGSYN